jgi:4-cresol dehydrogenase (hydroxylating)
MGLQNYNLQERSFAQAMAEISVIIGPENLIQDPEKVRIKSEDIIPRTRQALAFAYPANIEQIQKILAVANQHLLPIWPVSQGKNWGYGGS